MTRSARPGRTNDDANGYGLHPIPASDPGH